jgi:hypothetical protein
MFLIKILFPYIFSDKEMFLAALWAVTKAAAVIVSMISPPEHGVNTPCEIYPNLVQCMPAEVVYDPTPMALTQQRFEIPGGRN